MYAIVWVPETSPTGATSTTQAVKIDDYLEHEIAPDGTLIVHCLRDTTFVPAQRPDGPLAARGLSRGRTTSSRPGAGCCSSSTVPTAPGSRPSARRSPDYDPRSAARRRRPSVPRLLMRADYPTVYVADVRTMVAANVKAYNALKLTAKQKAAFEPGYVHQLLLALD